MFFIQFSTVVKGAEDLISFTDLLVDLYCSFIILLPSPAVNIYCLIYPDKNTKQMMEVQNETLTEDGKKN